MGVNSLPKTVTRQRRGCDLNPSPTAPETSTLTTRLPSHPKFTLVYWGGSWSSKMLGTLPAMGYDGLSSLQFFLNVDGHSSRIFKSMAMTRLQHYTVAVAW